MVSFFEWGLLFIFSFRLGVFAYVSWLALVFVWLVVCMSFVFLSFCASWLFALLTGALYGFLDVFFLLFCLGLRFLGCFSFCYFLLCQGCRLSTSLSALLPLVSFPPVVYLLGAVLCSEYVFVFSVLFESVFGSLAFLCFTLLGYRGGCRGGSYVGFSILLRTVYVSAGLLFRSFVRAGPKLTRKKKKKPRRNKKSDAITKAAKPQTKSSTEPKRQA